MKKKIKPKDTFEIDNKSLGRLRLEIVTIIVFFLAILTRLWFLQGIEAKTYRQLAEQNRTRILPIEAPRGVIFDRHGQLLVKNRLSLTVSLSQKQAGNHRLISKLAKLLSVSKKEIKKQLKSKKSSDLRAKPIRRDVSVEVVSYIQEHQKQFPGVRIKVEPVRQYTNGSLASHVLGYVGEISDQELKLKSFSSYRPGELVGKDGVEKSYENVLHGNNGYEVIEVNAANKPVKLLRKTNPSPGNDLKLTIDKDIQLSAEQALAKGIEKVKKGKYKHADAGAAVVMSPKNGEILAMASYPGYDPTNFVTGISSDLWSKLTSKESHFPLNNRAIMSSYPIGSTFKVVTAAAGLATGVVNPSSVVVCRGRWSGFGKRWLKWGWKRSGHGAVKLVTAIKVSCDIYFYEVGYRIYRRGQEELQQWARRFGLGKKTEVDLPGETAGRVPDKKWKRQWNKNWPENQAWFPGDTVNLAIGQGDLLVTPLQLANIYAAIANGGLLYQPHVVKEVLATNGKDSYQIPSKVIGKLDLPAKSIQIIGTGLREVTKKGGTAGSVFRGFPVPVAGKTGTAEVIGKDDFAFFVAYAPADDPQYVVAVVIEQGGHGGSAAAPVAKEIFSDIFGVANQTK
jgi:penicillin-binding protein 2